MKDGNEQPLANTQIVKPEFTIRFTADAPDKIQIVDTLELPEPFKVNILIPYLHDLYHALTLKTGNPKLGITRAILLEVASI